MRKLDNKWQLVLMLFLFVCIASALYLECLSNHKEPTPAVRPTVAPAKPAVTLRPVVLNDSYGHALVPGGVHTEVELRMHLKLYPGLDMKKVEFGLLDRTIVAYVSYLHNGKMYWSRKPRLLHQGELIITDGKMTILMKCGNLVSWTRPDDSVTEPNEPDDVYPAVSTVDVSMVVPSLYAPETDLPTTPLTFTLPPTTGGSPEPPAFIPCCGGVFVPGPGPDPTPTPEPSSVWMLLPPLLCLLLFANRS